MHFTCGPQQDQLHAPKSQVLACTSTLRCSNIWMCQYCEFSTINAYKFISAFKHSVLGWKYHAYDPMRSMKCSNWKVTSDRNWTRIHRGHYWGLSVILLSLFHRFTFYRITYGSFTADGAFACYKWVQHVVQNWGSKAYSPKCGLYKIKWIPTIDDITQ